MVCPAVSVRLGIYNIPCHLSKRVGHRVPVVGFLLVTGLNKIYDYVLALKTALDADGASNLHSNSNCFAKYPFNKKANTYNYHSTAADVEEALESISVCKLLLKIIVSNYMEFSVECLLHMDAFYAWGVSKTKLRWLRYVGGGGEEGVLMGHSTYEIDMRQWNVGMLQALGYQLIKWIFYSWLFIVLGELLG